MRRKKSKNVQNTTLDPYPNRKHNPHPNVPLPIWVFCLEKIGRFFFLFFVLKIGSTSLKLITSEKRVSNFRRRPKRGVHFPVSRARFCVRVPCDDRISRVDLCFFLQHRIGNNAALGNARFCVRVPRDDRISRVDQFFFQHTIGNNTTLILRNTFLLPTNAHRWQIQMSYPPARVPSESSSSILQ